MTVTLNSTDILKIHYSQPRCLECRRERFSMPVGRSQILFGSEARRPIAFTSHNLQCMGSLPAASCRPDGAIWADKLLYFGAWQVINASSSTSAGFDATWHWPVSPDTVHSFPHVTFSSDDLPISLDDISSLRLAAMWAMTAGNSPSKGTGIDDSIGSAKAKCNVAFDLFLDRDPDNASSAINASYEIMVWIGRVGDPYPLGYSSQNASCYTQQLGSFNL